MYSVHVGLTTKKRVVHFLAQVMNESGALKATSENMNYSAQRLMQVWPSRFKTLEQAEQYAHNPEKLANNVYANRMGNGNEQSGDGWRFRGRGYIGLTGRQNYSDFNSFDLCTVDVLKNPDKVASYPLNQICAMWFWEKYGLNAVADTDTGGLMSEQVVERITRKVNGGYLGLAQRKYYYKRFAREFGL
jgi:putative chitinase